MVELSLGYFILLLILIFRRPIANLIVVICKLLVYFCAPENLNLRDKYGDWAVVTGSTDGIGKAYAKELARRNVNLVLISRTMEKLNRVKSEIQQTNPEVEVKVVQADFSRGREELTLVENELKDVPVGILVNNVGRMTDTLEYHGRIPEKDIWDMVTINDGATVKMTHMIIEQMKKRRKGAIVNVSSGADITPIPLQAVYAASKIFVTYFSDAIRHEYSGHGITVQCLSPFYINTKMAEFSPTVKDHPLMYPNAEVYAKSAIKTLGILNSTSGYWVHEIMTFVITLIPIWLRPKIMFLINRKIRSEYIAKQKAKERSN